MRWWCSILHAVVVAVAAVYISDWAYKIRMVAVDRFGPIIHEFDPHFNLRAAEHLDAVGSAAFFRWFDHKSWYPLGRPVATTIYPGMQFAAVGIHHGLNLLGYSGYSLHAVCAMLPVWFGVGTSLATGMLAFESCRWSGFGTVAGLVAASVMAVSPAHLSRSVGGGYDNEAAAMLPMCLSLWLWCRAVRGDRHSWAYGSVAGAAYAAMANSWGGHVIIPNLICVHTLLLLLMRKRNGCTGIHKAYILFCVVSGLAISFMPHLAWKHLYSAEQMAPAGVFLLVLLHGLCQCRTGGRDTNSALWLVLAMVLGAGMVAMLLMGVIKLPRRLQSIVMEVELTGNPLVDSVLEHQPMSPDAFWRYLHITLYAVPVGSVCLLAHNLPSDKLWPDAAALLVVLLTALVFLFAGRMSRLVVFLAVPASVCSGAAVSTVISLVKSSSQRSKLFVPLAVLAIAAGAWHGLEHFESFRAHCYSMAEDQLSNPQIVWHDNDGKLVDDYREAYAWLKKETPEDTRVMSWWDYGYQINALADRTTLADGNTWNTEHIGLVGLMLTSPVPESWLLARHLADYVLVWSQSDVGKSTHMAKIANSVYEGHCAEKNCDQYGMQRSGQPSDSMGQSLVWHLCRDRQNTELRKYFEPVYHSPRGLVTIARVVKPSSESKEWVENNRQCDAPGSWYCPGQYPIQLRETLQGNKTDYLSMYSSRLERLRELLPKPNGATAPDGSYLGSCSGCQLTSETKFLRCTHCQAPGYVSGYSDLDFAKCSSKMVDNIHGELRCKPPPNAEGLPSGGYLHSCGGCTQQGLVVHCEVCGKADGRQKSAQYDMARCAAPAKLDNNNGALVCKGVSNGVGIPSGSYRSSCSGCFVADSLLSCSHCSASDGSQRESSIDTRSCNGQTVGNNNGQLKC